MDEEVLQSRFLYDNHRYNLSLALDPPHFSQTEELLDCGCHYTENGVVPVQNVSLERATKNAALRPELRAEQKPG